ncbi:hypothetical protein PV325_002878 [Microctonus aethiopoides]|nr:hypothetical protein PV325_002878 [Microctonus aethiopoides]
MNSKSSLLLSSLETNTAKTITGVTIRQITSTSSFASHPSHSNVSSLIKVKKELPEDEIKAEMRHQQLASHHYTFCLVCSPERLRFLRDVGSTQAYQLPRYDKSVIQDVANNPFATPYPYTIIRRYNMYSL